MLEALLVARKELIIPQGQIIFESSQNWIVPLGVRSICTVLVGRGGVGTKFATHLHRGGGGGALSYRNDIPVTPGETLNLFFSTDHVSLRRGVTVLARANYANGSIGGTASVLAGLVSYPGGTAGTLGSYVLSNSPVRTTGGAGAGGYAGKGADSPSVTTVPAKGTGATAIEMEGNAGVGGSGGSAVSRVAPDGFGLVSDAYGGGGVGLLGQGTNGRAGTHSNYRNNSGGGGSGGDVGWRFWNPGYAGTGKYGGGGSMDNDLLSVFGIAGVRIIWGAGRRFPNILTNDRPIITL